MIDLTTFKMLLRDTREERGFTQAEFAEKIGVSPATESNYESHKNNAIPDIDVFQKMADVLEVSQDYLLGKTKYKNNHHEKVYKSTGLSGSAINKIEKISESSVSFIGNIDKHYYCDIGALNMIIENDNFYNFLAPLSSILQEYALKYCGKKGNWEDHYIKLKDILSEDDFYKEWENHNFFLAFEALKSIIKDIRTKHMYEFIKSSDIDYERRRRDYSTEEEMAMVTGIRIEGASDGNSDQEE